MKEEKREVKPGFNHLPQYPESGYSRKRQLVVLLSETRKTFGLHNLTVYQASKKQNALMLSWPMTARAANSAESRLRKALIPFRCEADQYTHSNAAILTVWKEQNEFLEWI
jgi:hypothetical protein